jgi:hypothetical protein
MTEAMFFRFGRQNWIGVYAFMFLKERNNTPDYAAKNMKLYAVRLWFPEYVDAEKTKIVLNIFEGEFTRHVRRSLSRHSRRCAAINVYILLYFSLRPWLLPQQLLDEVPLPNRQGERDEKQGDNQVERQDL